MPPNLDHKSPEGPCKEETFRVQNNLTVGEEFHKVAGQLGNQFGNYITSYFFRGDSYYYYYYYYYYYASSLA